MWCTTWVPFQWTSPHSLWIFRARKKLPKEEKKTYEELLKKRQKTKNKKYTENYLKNGKKWLGSVTTPGSHGVRHCDHWGRYLKMLQHELTPAAESGAGLTRNERE